MTSDADSATSGTTPPVGRTTVAGKVFTMVYIVVGIGVFVALVSTTAHHLLEAKKGD